jgi:hypothetical protein
VGHRPISHKLPETVCPLGHRRFGCDLVTDLLDEQISKAQCRIEIGWAKRMKTSARLPKLITKVGTRPQIGRVGQVVPEVVQCMATPETTLHFLEGFINFSAVLWSHGKSGNVVVWYDGLMSYLVAFHLKISGHHQLDIFPLGIMQTTLDRRHRPRL